MRGIALAILILAETISCATVAKYQGIDSVGYHVGNIFNFIMLIFALVIIGFGL